MKRMLTIAMLVCLTGVLPGLSACNPDDDREAPGVVTPAPKPEPPAPEPAPDPPTGNQLRITAGGRIFAATLEDTASARAFKALLPLSVQMGEMNGNEKYYNLPQNLPTAASAPGAVRTGELMLWGQSTLVLFYQTFSTSYSYTRLGQIDNPSGLAAALGSGSVEVQIEVL